MPLPPPGPHAHVLVTGASSGIGAETARALATRGYPTVLVARREDALTDLAAELERRSGLTSEVHAADLGDDDARAGVRDRLRHDDRIVGLVNAAGFGATGHVVDQDPEVLDGLIRVNVLALHDLSVAAVDAFVGRARSTGRSGAVLNVSSITAFQPLPGVASYAASKAFVQAFSEAVHTELAGTGVSLTTLSPGLTRTGFADAAGTEAFDRAPGFTVGEAADVAEAGVAAMVAGQRSVVPGLVNQLSALSGRLTPRTVLLPVVHQAMGWFGGRG